MRKFFAFRARKRAEDPPKDINPRNFDNSSNLNWQGVFLFVVYIIVVFGFFLFSRTGKYGSVDGPAPIPPRNTETGEKGRCLRSGEWPAESRVGKKLHYFATCLVCLGSHFSVVREGMAANARNHFLRRGSSLFHKMRRNLGGSQDNDYGRWDEKGPVLRVIGSISSNALENPSIPAGRIKRKNGSVAAVDIRERSNVDWLMPFIIQVAAVSCADTQVPETTVANQSLLKVGFCKALQLEVAFIRTEGISPPRRLTLFKPLEVVT
jgi:hypothetical protein